jgi:zinc finger protein
MSLTIYTVDDPAGNSFIQNPNAPSKDVNMETSSYCRSTEQDRVLGLQPETAVHADKLGLGGRNLESFLIESRLAIATGTSGDSSLDRHEVISIPQLCPSCRLDGEALTAVTSIPHFKEIIIMAFNCSHCGFRNNDIK